jgi:GNAT superfamily N-acetyltransferase
MTDAPIAPAVALEEAGIPAGRAAELVDAGLTTVLAGELLVLAAVDEPVTGERQVLVTLGAAGVLSDPSRLAELRALVAREHPDATTIVFRLPPGSAPLPVLGARLLLQYVESETVPEPPAEEAGWTVRPYQPADREAVHDLLVTALETGYRIAGASAPRAQTDAVATGLLDRAGDDVTVFCAVGEPGFGGHATVVWDTDDLTGRDRPELFDVFVLPEHRGSPVGRLLTAVAIRWAAGAGFPLRGHVVGDDDNAATVRRRLLAGGWRPAESYWAVPAAGGG